MPGQADAVAPAKQCDNASVGVLVERTDGNGRPRWLFIWRNTFPFSVAPVSGHVFDEHLSYTDAARAELKEEVGLDVTEVHWTPVGGWRLNRCRREPGPKGTGHQWEIYVAYLGLQVPELKLSEREVKLARWLSAPQVQLLANQTVLYAHGRVSDSEFQDFPGIEPVWVGFLAELDVVRLPVADLLAVEQLAADGEARL